MKFVWNAGKPFHPEIAWAGLLDSWKRELQSNPALRTSACHESHDFTTYLTLTISHALLKLQTTENCGVVGLISKLDITSGPTSGLLSMLRSDWLSYY